MEPSINWLKEPTPKTIPVFKKKKYIRNFVSEEIIVYTDGGCSPNPGFGAWAFRFKRGGKITELSGSCPNTTNNRMELTAFIKALELIPTGTYTLIYSDSRLAVKTVNSWLKAWKSKGWIKSDGTPPQNLDLLKELDTLLQGRKVKAVWLKGHAGNFNNERCDELVSQKLRGF